MVGRAAGFGHDLNYAAVGLAIFRLKGAGLHLYFLDEGKIDAGSERPVAWAVDTKTTVAGIVNADTVSYILIFKPGRPADRRVRVARAATIHRAWGNVEKAADVALRQAPGSKRLKSGCRQSRSSSCLLRRWRPTLPPFLRRYRVEATKLMLLERLMTTSTFFASAILKPSFCTLIRYMPGVRLPTTKRPAAV